MRERIQKVLANAGHGSRRQIESLIRDDKITINGKLAILGQQIDYKDRIVINSHQIRLPQQRESKPKSELQKLFDTANLDEYAEEVPQNKEL